MLKVFGWNEEVTLEFLQTLKDGAVVAKALRVLFLPKIVANIMDFPLEWEEFLEAMDSVTARA